MPYLHDGVRFPKVFPWRPEGSQQTALLLSPSSSLFNTYISDPAPKDVSAVVVFRIGHSSRDYYEVTSSGSVTGQTWRGAMEELLALASFQVSHFGFEPASRRHKWQSAHTVRQAISLLEQEMGCKAAVVVDNTRVQDGQVTSTCCKLYDVSFATNEGWDIKGEAPWEGFVEVQPS